MYPEWWRTTGVPFWKGEHQFVAALGKDKARALLEKHWDTWVGVLWGCLYGVVHIRTPHPVQWFDPHIAQNVMFYWDEFDPWTPQQVTKEDLVTLKNAGITHLRIPIGYWCVCACMCVCVCAWKMHVNGDRCGCNVIMPPPVTHTKRQRLPPLPHTHHTTRTPTAPTHPPIHITIHRILGDEWMTEGEAYLPGGWPYLERCVRVFCLVWYTYMCVCVCVYVYIRCVYLHC